MYVDEGKRVGYVRVCAGESRSFKKDLGLNPTASGIYSERCVFYAPLAGIEKRFLKRVIDSFIAFLILRSFSVWLLNIKFECYHLMR